MDVTDSHAESSCIGMAKEYGSAIDRTADKPCYPQQDYGTYHRGDEAAYYAACGDAKKAEEPSAKHAAYDSHDKIDDNAEATAAHKFPGYKARENTDDNIPKKTHNK